MAPPIIGKLIAYGIGFAFLALLIAGIILLIQNITCKSGPANVYEHFDDSDDYLSNLKTKLTHVKKAIDTIQNDMDVVNDAADETCDIMKNVEDTYISNGSAPSDDSEYSMPQSVQQDRLKQRRARAAKNFKVQQNLFIESHNKHPLLECFASPEDVGEAEQNLNDSVRELTSLLDSAEMKLAVTKGEQTWMTLLFNAPYLKKAIDSTTPKTSENFDTVKGADILSKADELVGKANTLHARFQQVHDQVKTQKTVATSLTKKSGDLQKGKISQSDISTALTNSPGVAPIS
jgi:hypothetical protein